MVHGAGSPCNAWRCLNEHFLSLNDSQINVWNHKLAHLKMKQAKDPHILSSQLEIFGVSLMLKVRKDDKTVCTVAGARRRNGEACHSRTGHT